MKRILILGGTGFVGRHICTRLSQAGWSAIVPSRSPAAARHLAGLPRVDVVPGDVHDEATLIRLLAGADAVVNLVAILHGSEAAFEQVHVELPKKLARACAAAGVRRLVQVSALGAAQDGPSMYQRSKARGEAVLKAAATAGTLDLSVLRPSVIFGAQDKFLNVFAQLQRMFPLIPLAGADTRFQPVWVEDVAAAVMRCLQDDATIGQTFEACGPEVFTLRDLVRLAGQYAGVNQGRGRAVFALPMPLARLQAWLMERLPGEPLMSGDNLDSMAVDNIASGKVPGLDALGITPAALAAIAPGYLRKR
ncbi:MAG: complex I NDUFA9 subunit family protein [Comamonadaceae bacterium]|uniref:complex I NDUFA9 subunit family protein n=1 Tax=Candidatus Skiveiella danica TaxID=3386177 RepID=UPI00390ADC4E|nr:complex I NDUFA9 subunit family protein [Comamonadaceae bacterium]